MVFSSFSFRQVLVCLFVLACFRAGAQGKVISAANGHSHNDYLQRMPFWEAFHSGMGSIEADVFLSGDRLLVGHDRSQLSGARTLGKLYLEPIADLFSSLGGKLDSTGERRLQLVIDIKQDHRLVIPRLLEELKSYGDVFDPVLNPRAVRIVLSGDMPAKERFGDYPGLLSFDGRPSVEYAAGQLERIGMISASMEDYTVWNGKGTPTPSDLGKLKAVVDRAHALGKPFRFWATKDTPNSWKELEHIGADWIGTDRPRLLEGFYAQRKKMEYTTPKAYGVYRPSYKSDGERRRAKNVILLIGDGMGLAQIQAGLTANFGSSNLAFMRYIGLSRTEAVNSDFTDSAAGATAMATGSKTNNRYVGVDSVGRPLVSLVDTLAGFGIRSGIISSGDVTDATPAAFYAHRAERSMSREISSDLLSSKVSVLVGSGRSHFSANPDSGLMEKLSAKGFKHQKELKGFLGSSADRQLVLLADSSTRRVSEGRGDMLQVSLSKTVSLLSGKGKGFFIMAEGAKIDHGGHANDVPFMVSEQHDFDRLVGEALRFADRDGETLVVVTADHETGGFSLLDAWAHKGYLRGNFSTDDHTNIMVPVFAYGPGSQEFIGVYPNTDIFYRIIRAYGLK